MSQKTPASTSKRAPDAKAPTLVVASAPAAAVAASKRIPQDKQQQQEVEEGSFSFNEGDDDEDTSNSSNKPKGSTVTPASNLKRRRIMGVTVPRPSTKWIKCLRSGHHVYVMPGSAADGLIPAFADLPDGQTRMFCNAHGKKCCICQDVTSLIVSATCDNPACKKFYCLEHAKWGQKAPVGLWFCNPICQKAAEKCQPTKYIQPYCSQNFKPGTDGRPREQNWIACLTCMINVCTACASTCHAGHVHRVGRNHKEGEPYESYGTTECRCGALQCCKSTKQQDATSAKVIELAAAAKEKYALVKEEATMVGTLIEHVQRADQVQKTRADLKARDAHLTAELKRFADNRRVQLGCMQKHIGALLQNTDGYTDDALTELRKGLDALTVSMQKLTDEKATLPRLLEKADRELALIQKHQQELKARQQKLPGLLQAAEARLKKAAE
jgi:hypothetical protein